MKIGYYPGCTLHSSAKEYDLSAQLILSNLGVELQEIKDWNCCGAFEAASVSHLLSLALPARNLSIAAKEFQKVVMPSQYHAGAFVETLRLYAPDTGFRFTTLQAHLKHFL